MDIKKHNRNAWNKNVEDKNRWTEPVDHETVEKARRGEWEIILTPTKPVPHDWYPPLNGAKVLCLASGGGQQGPILAAAGAEVTVFDLSDNQLAQDQAVAARENLAIKTVQGSMDDLSAFADDTFDLIVHPCSNLFIDNILPVWREAYRVTKPGGTMISGFVNPVMYIFDPIAEADGRLEVDHSIPYSDARDLPEEYVGELIKNHRTLEFGHSLEDQIKGQTDAGFVIAGFFEDSFGGETLLDNHIDSFIATKAVKLK